MDREYLLEYETVQRWLANIVKDSTRRAYLAALELFVEFVDMDPDRIVAVGRNHPDRIHHHMKMQFKSSDLSSNTRMARYQALRSFCSANRVQLAKKPRTFRAVPEHEPREIYDPQEVVELIDAATGFRYKAVIAFLAQSGQRVGVVTNLKLEHLDLDKEPPLVVQVPPVLRDTQGRNVNKVETPYEFAIGEDTVQYLRLMVAGRENRGEPLDRESPIFRSYAAGNPKDPPKKKDYSRPGPPLSTSATSQMVRDTAKKAGIQRKHGKRYLYHPHGFRRFWKHQMRRAGIDQDLLDYMLGHRLPYGGAYDRWTLEDIRREYRKAEPHLRVRPRLSEKKEETNRGMNLLQILAASDPHRLQHIAERVGISPIQIQELVKAVNREA